MSATVTGVGPGHVIPLMRRLRHIDRLATSSRNVHPDSDKPERLHQPTGDRGRDLAGLCPSPTD